MNMAVATKRAWKLQEFVAHGASVNCMSLGHKSGRVLVTGGEDKKVNLWAVGKPNCIMSLTGHTTPVECVRFGHSEELVCAGSLSGALKIWDLEAAKIVRTLTGHKANIKSLDFHPYGDFLASGSTDTNIKLWDIRRKGCIFTYKGHTNTVNSLRFSPDGRWIASAGEDGAVKLWDLPAGKMLAEFRSHLGAVRDVEFHPNEFLLASGSLDRTIKFWDLESFQLVSSTDGDSGPINCIYFNPDGECLYSGAQDMLVVHGWEPARIFDSLTMGWGKVADIATAQNQLIGASFLHANVSIYVVDLKRVQPFGGIPNPSPPSIPFQPGTHIRKSFIRQKPQGNQKQNSAAVQVKTTEELEPLTPDIDPGDDATSVADIKDFDDYKAIFQPRGRELARTPPPPGRVDPFPPPPEEVPETTSNVRRLRGPKKIKSDPVRTEVFRSELLQPDPPKIESLRAELVCPEIIKPEPVLSEPSRPVTSQSDTTRADFCIIDSCRTERIPEPVKSTPSLVTPMNAEPQIYVSIKKTESESNKIERSENIDYIPSHRDQPAGLDLDDFLPYSLKNFNDSLRIGHQAQPDISEAEAISSIMKGHDSMIAVLTNRHRHLQIVHTLWNNKDIKTAIESAVHMNDQAVLVDILNIICLKASIWSLDLCVTLLPCIFDLLQSRYEVYMAAGCNALRLILKNFATVIKSNISAAPSIGIDLQREERYNKCMSCYNQLLSIRAFLLKRQTLQGKLGQTFRELHILMQVLD